MILKFNEENVIQFFFNYYIRKYQLNELYAQYISISLVDETVSKQHYALIEPHKLAEDYQDAFDKTLSDCSFSEFIKKDLEPYRNNFNAFGSKIILRKNFIIDFFSVIKSVYNEIDDEHIKINIRSSYIYFLLLFITGLRPLVRFNLNFNNLNLEQKYINIRDKYSNKYAENRPIPINNFFINEFKNLIKLNDIFFNKIKYVEKNKYSVADNYSKLYLFADNKYLDFNISNLKKYFYCYLPEKFQIIKNIKQNFFRHHFKTYLLKKDIPENFIDNCLGHNFAGQEMFNQFSTFDILEFQKKVRKIQTEMIYEFNIQSIFK